MSGNTYVTNCTTGLSSGFCTYYSEPCQSGKYFDGTTHKTCIAGSYCDGSGTATPGVSGCSKACPENSTSTSGATKCTCNTGYEMIGGACVLKTCESGYYLNGNECTVCPVGSYCANNIKTACDDGYTTDATGATDVSQCYTTCEQQCTQQTCPDNATCTHGTTVTTGKQYVGGTCNAKQTMCGIDITCDTGYNKTDSGIEIVEKTPLIPVDYHESGDDYAYVNASGDLSGGSSDFYNSIDITEPNTWASHFDYGTVYGRASCQTSMDPGIEYSYMNLEGILSGDISLSEYETNMTAISGGIKAKYITNLVAEMLAGTKTYADLSLVLWTMLGTGSDINYNANSTGDVCYCQMTEFVSASDIKHVIEDAPWVWFDVVWDNKGCPSICAQYCAMYLKHSNDFYEGFRAATFGSLGVQTKATCEIAIIDIPAGYYLPANTTEPVQCPKNNYCPGVTGAMFNATDAQGIIQCPAGTTSFAGASGIEQCTGPKSLHIGDDIQMNLTTVKPQTARVMVFDVLGELYYGGLSDTPKSINKNTDKHDEIVKLVQDNIKLIKQAA